MSAQLSETTALAKAWKNETLKNGWRSVSEWVFCTEGGGALDGRESSPYVKEQMGHSSIHVTVDVYGHLIPGANRQAVDRLDDATKRNVRAHTKPPKPFVISGVYRGCGGPLCTVLHGPRHVLGRPRPSATSLSDAIP